ncbi:MAG: 50S ribosomal protein L23 [Candidatus Micrarchaeia archaeon]
MTSILYPVTTEKAVAGIERENRMTFVVEASATKKDVKSDAEKLFKEKVAKVTILVTPNGRKKAMVRFARAGAAADVAAKLKMV